VICIGRLSQVCKVLYDWCNNKKVWNFILVEKYKEYSTLQLSVKQCKFIYRTKAGGMRWDTKRKSMGLTLSNNNYTVTSENGYWNCIFANTGITFGKWLWEIKVYGRITPFLEIGVAGNNVRVWNNKAASSEESVWVLNYNGKLYHNKQAIRVRNSRLKVSDRVLVYLNMEERRIGFIVNNVLLAIIQGLPEVVYPIAALSGEGLTVDLCAGPEGVNLAFPNP